ncbi:MAG: hypothetical protein LBP22_03370 [Deltaproteobacteria bacterium]|nr:hypothetical protein [Deltaproteobacteria bacterium]
MAENRRVDIDALITNEKVVVEAIRKGTREAMKRHIAAGVPMVSWEDGKVVEIPPEKLAQMLQEK